MDESAAEGLDVTRADGAAAHAAAHAAAYAAAHAAAHAAPPDAAPDEQLTLGRQRRRATRRPAVQPAAAAPVARVVVDLPLAHLDRPFDYLVPQSLDATVVAGGRVRVRFAGRLVDGYVVERVAASDHDGRLAYLAGATSAEPVVTPDVLGLARAVADRYAGTLADVLRLAVPPRHAAVEAEPAGEPLQPPPPPDPAPWEPYAAGPALLTALADGRAPRAVWAALPAGGGAGWPAALAAATQATLAGKRGALIVVPDGRDVARVDAALTAALGPGHHVTLTAELGPRERYRRFLAARRGAVRAVVGTRAAAFAPVADLGLVAIWDDGDDLHAEPRAPYPHARDVLVLRAGQAGCALVIGGHAVTAEAALLLRSGWARPVVPASRAVTRAVAPLVVTPRDDDEARDPAARAARLPRTAWEAARASLAAGAPVLVQVPRRGYQPALACAGCRSPARCATCAGPLGRHVARAANAADPVPSCGWCGRPAGTWRCSACGADRLRAVVVGAGRTAEELGRAFPGVPVRTSGRDGVLDRVAGEPALVVATPGAEPVADGGYGAVLLLDPWALLGRPDLRAAEETLRRWLAAAALARAGPAGGRVVVSADAGLAPVQALVRWDPLGYAQRELADRAALGFPPVTRIAAVTGSPGAIAEVAAEIETELGAADGNRPAVDVLGPVPVPRPASRRGPGEGSGPADEVERLILRVGRDDAARLVAATRAVLAARSARKADPVRVALDPLGVL